MPATGNPRTSSAAAPQQARAGMFGERLRREREMRGIKLEEIAESTKIGKRNLQALEDEHFDQLPGGIFNKGFVRAYAKFLGLDEEQAVNDFLAASANYDQPDALQPLAAIASQRAAVIPSDHELRRKERLWTIAALVALILAGIIYWRWKSSGKPMFIQHVHAAASAPAPPPVAPPAETNPADATTVIPAQQSTQPAPAPPQPAASNPAQAAAKDVPPKPASPAPAANHTASSDGVSLIIHANEESWISITADGQAVLDSTLAAGESRQVRADRELVLKTGNAGGLEVSFNGQPLPALGKEKQVKTLTFSVDGLEPTPR